MNEEAEKLALLLGQLANKHRLLILCALQEKPMTVGEIAGYVPGISGAALSQHLHRLRAAGLVRSQKEGQFVWYSLGDQRMRLLMDLLKREYCGKDPSSREPLEKKEKTEAAKGPGQESPA